MLGLAIVNEQSITGRNRNINVNTTHAHMHLLIIFFCEAQAEIIGLVLGTMA